MKRIMIAIWFFVSLCLYSNVYGQTTPQDNPTQLTAGDHHTCLLKDHKVVCWGQNHKGQLDVPDMEYPREIAAGGDLNCAIDENKVLCWGDGRSGQVTAAEFKNPSLLNVFDRGTGACFYDEDVFKCIGGDLPSEIPNEDAESTRIPERTRIPVRNPDQFITGFATICYRENDRVICWRYRWPNLIDFRTERQEFAGVTSLAIGKYNICGLRAGELICTGNTPIVPANFQPDTVYMRHDNICIKDATKVKCWGVHGQSSERSLRGVTHVAIGLGHVCALHNDEVDCWGRNDFGQLDATSAIQGRWAGFREGALAFRDTGATNQIELTLSEDEPFSLWQRDRLRLTNLSDNNKIIELYNLADTGCYAEKGISFTGHTHEPFWSIRATSSARDECQQNLSRIFFTDVSNHVNITNHEKESRVSLADNKAIKRYWSYPHNRNNSTWHISLDGRFLLANPTATDRSHHHEKPIIPYAPEILLINLENHTALRISIAGVDALQSIAMDKNSFLLSFTNHDWPYFAFGDLWRLNPDTLTLQQVKGEQIPACGTGTISMVRDRISSQTNSAMVCGGSPNHHQAEFNSPYELQMIYSDINSSQNGYFGSYILDLYPTRNMYLNRQESLHQHRFTLTAETNNVTVAPADPLYTWPLPLFSTADKDQDARKASTRMDGWLENSVLNITITTTQDLPEKLLFRLGINFGLVDAQNTHHSARNNRAQPFLWPLYYEVDTTTQTIHFDEAALLQSGIPAETVSLIKNACCQHAYQAGKHEDSEIIHHFTMNIENFPLKTIEAGVGFKVDILDAQSRELLASTANTKHQTNYNDWNYFAPLTNLLTSNLGGQPLRNNIASGQHRFAFLIQGDIHLYDPDQDSWKEFQRNILSQEQLDAYGTDWQRLSTEDRAGFTSTPDLIDVYYRKIENGWRVYFLTTTGFQETQNQLIVHDYSPDGQQLRNSTFTEIEYICYRCETADLDYEKTTLYDLGNGREIIAIDTKYLVLDTKTFSWLTTEGNPADIFADNLGPNPIRAIPETEFIKEMQEQHKPFDVMSNSIINNELPVFERIKTAEPLSGLIYADPYLETCIQNHLVELYPEHPGARLADLKELDCTQSPITHLDEIPHFSGLQTLALQLASDADLSALSSLTGLKSLTLILSEGVNLESISSLKTLKQLTLSGNRIDLSSLQGLTITQLTLKANTVDLSLITSLPLTELTVNVQRLNLLPLAAMDQLKVLNLESSSFSLSDYKEVVTISHTVEQLRYLGRPPAMLLQQFPALKYLTLGTLISDACPSSPHIEEIILSSYLQAPMHSSCYPKLRVFKEAGNGGDCSINHDNNPSLTGDPFTNLKVYSTSVYCPREARMTPNLEELTVNRLLSPAPESLKKLTLNSHILGTRCPADEYFSKIQNTTVECTLHDGQLHNATTLRASFQLTRTADGELQSSIKTLTADLKDKSSLYDEWPHQSGYRKPDFSQLESIDIKANTGINFAKYFAAMPQLKTIKASSYNRIIDENFVFTLPDLKHLQTLELGRFSKLDLSALEKAPLTHLSLQAREATSVDLTLDFSKLIQLQSLTLSYGFTFNPAQLPCSLDFVRVFFIADSADLAQACFAPAEVIMQGSDLKTHKNLVQSAPTSKLYSQPGKNSRLWRQADWTLFKNQRTDWSESIEEQLYHTCRHPRSATTGDDQLDLIWAFCILDRYINI